MMDINGILHFAPSIPLKVIVDSDWDGDQLPEQFRQRIEGFYLEPAKYCIDAKHAFAAGLVLVSCIDALARFKYQMFDGEGVVSKRINKFLMKELKSFKDEALASDVRKQFRNGLVHEARLKDGARFSLEIAETLDTVQGVLIVNPERLLDEVCCALNTYIEHLKVDQTARCELISTLKKDLEKDIQAVTLPNQAYTGANAFSGSSTGPFSPQ